jgi:hypothetical protein
VFHLLTSQELIASPKRWFATENPAPPTIGTRNISNTTIKNIFKSVQKYINHLPRRMFSPKLYIKTIPIAIGTNHQEVSPVSATRPFTRT